MMEESESPSPTPSPEPDENVALLSDADVGELGEAASRVAWAQPSAACQVPEPPPLRRGPAAPRPHRTQGELTNWDVRAGVADGKV